VLVQKSSDLIQISISDQGPGIPEHELENVFAPFYRVDKSRNKQPGSGLGLAVARDIIRAHGGDITLINRQPHGLTAMVIFKDSR
jgi:signal transduction histidine kinase